MNKEVLIYLYKDQLSPKGGPLGYNYNLMIQLKLMGYKNIHFIESHSYTDSINKKINNIKYKWLKVFFIILKSIYKKTRTLYGHNHKAVVDLSKYDIIHFHSTMDMFNAKDSLKTYKGKVILTSHSPTLLSKEIYDRLSDFEKRYLHVLYKNLIKIDIYAFHRADYLIFPCKEAEEPYFHNWKDYEMFRRINAHKIKYLLTGIEKCHAQVPASEIRQKYKIPHSAFLVCYVGRHNEIKGYDQLKTIGKELLEKYPNLYFLIAGKEEPMKRISHPRWIEAGWTNDPHSIINASNVFILPNKETYFDLVMLEVLSLGKIIVASRTGGNKYFEHLDTKGIKLFNTPNEAVSLIEKIMNSDESQRAQMENSNLSLYEQYFTSSSFANNYIKLINSL